MNRSPVRHALTLETKALLYLFLGAICGWLVLKTAPKLYAGRLEAIDNQLLRALRRPENAAVRGKLTAVEAVGSNYLITAHPSSVLGAPDPEARQEEFCRLVQDLTSSPKTRVHPSA
jgi:hypothetical protein